MEGGGMSLLPFLTRGRPGPQSAAAGGTIKAGWGPSFSVFSLTDRTPQTEEPSGQVSQALVSVK